MCETSIRELEKEVSRAHMKELRWMTARTTTVYDWEKAMIQIKACDANA